MNTLIVGPMFSGKSTLLLQKIERAVYGRKSVLLIRPKKDDRGYFTHNLSDGFQRLVDENKLKVLEIEQFDDEIIEKICGYDSIFVDEYFMIKNNKLLARSMRKYNPRQDIVFAGLLATSENMIFVEASDILPYMEEIIKLNSVCMICGSDLANYSMFNGTKTAEIVIGDEDKYKCVCKSCYEKEKGFSNF